LGGRSFSGTGECSEHTPMPDPARIAQAKPGDYTLRPGGRFLAGVAALWEPLLGPRIGSLRRTFPVAGYFDVPHPTVPHLRVVVLDTVEFSAKFKITLVQNRKSENRLPIMFR
jgi:hypothetical protein